MAELGYIAAPSEDIRKTVRDTSNYNKINLISALLGTPQEAKAIPLIKELIFPVVGEESSSRFQTILASDESD
jgi:hypothetical protein